MVSEKQKLKNVKALDTALLHAVPQLSLVVLSDTYSLSNIQPQFGEWYFGASCNKCRQITPILSDTTKGAHNNPFTGRGAVKVRCFYCRNMITSIAKEILSFQWIKKERGKKELDIPDKHVQFTERHFLGILMEAVYFCEFSTNSSLAEPEKKSFLKISILSAVFAVECAANLLIDQISLLSSKLKDQVDKMPTIEKYEFFMLFRNDTTKFDRGCKEVQAIQEMIKFRNNQVHLTSIASQMEKDVSKSMTFQTGEKKMTNVLKLPTSVTQLDYSHALAVLQNVDAFFEKYFISWCKLDKNEVGSILFDFMLSEQKGTFLLQHPSYHKNVPAKTKKMGLRFSYIPSPIEPNQKIG